MKKELNSMKIIRSIISIICILAAQYFNALAQWYVTSPEYRSTPFTNGEVLRYKVKWKFIRLGTIEMYQTQSDPNNPSTFVVKMITKSASGIPFINLNILNQSVLNAISPRNNLFTVKAGTKTKEEATYKYDAVSHTIMMEGKEDGKEPIKKNISYNDPYFDALGMLMLARCVAHTAWTITIPTIIDYQIKNTELKFRKEIEEIEVDAWNEPIRARRFDAKAGWENNTTGGMKGSFSCWISADEAAIPLYAEIEIALGSIKIELESFSRQGWTPGVEGQSISKKGL